jgi:hypothetical protein
LLASWCTISPEHMGNTPASLTATSVAHEPRQPRH